METQQEEDNEGINGINITPLVDVSLVLVLIFMVTTPFIVKSLIPVQLPKAVTSEAEDKENITVSISPEDGFAVNEIPVDKADLKLTLQQQFKSSGFSFLLIRADERIPHGEVEYVMRIGKQLGAKRIAFATVPK
jgi:biopolymer transport protein ExbD